MPPKKHQTPISAQTSLSMNAQQPTPKTQGHPRNRKLAINEDKKLIHLDTNTHHTCPLQTRQTHMSFIDYFDQTRIINMKSRTDRRKETEDEFLRYQLPINTKNVRFFDAITPDTPNNFPNIGARGCFMSHLSILETAAKTNPRRIFLVEDDIQFSNQIIEFGSRATESLETTDWDIAYFGHLLKSSSTSPHWKAVSEPMLLSHCYAVNGATIERLAHFLRQMLERPAGDPQGGPMHYDGALNTFLAQNPDIKAYYYSKNLGYQRPSKTNIHQNSIIDRNPLLKPLSQTYRAAKRIYLRLIK